MHESIVFCSACTMSSLRKFTYAISSPDEFLVYNLLLQPILFVHSIMSRSSCRMGMGGIWELLDGKIWEWDLSFRWEWDGNGNEVIEMGGICYEKSRPAYL